MTLSTKIEVFYGFYICSQWAFIHALLSRVPFALAGLSCYTIVYRKKCIESTVKSENVMFESVAKVRPFKVMHKCISSVWTMVKLHMCF